ncbi:MAG: hypothetical protein ACI4SK_05555 [Christensenellales bacterium]
MGRRIDIDLSYDSLIKYAKNALKNGDSVACALNLNEALENATDREQRRLVYELFVECFRTSSSITAIMQAVCKEIEERNDEEYYRFDFALKKKYGVFEEDASDFDTIRKSNDIRFLLAERRYDEAMELLTSVLPKLSQSDGIIDALNDAVDLDKSLNLDKFILQILPLMTSAGSKADVVRLMLEGGPITHRMIIESVDYLLDDDDSNALCLMGMALFENNETEISRKFFKKALLLDTIDEDALYYMTVLNILKKDDEDKDDYWGRYKQIYKVTEPPVGLMEKLFDSKKENLLCPYRTLPPAMLGDRAATFMVEANAKEDISEERKKEIEDFCKMAPENASKAVISAYGTPSEKPNLTALYLSLLSSARVPDGLKEDLYSALIGTGYEGNITILNEERVVKFRITKLHKRVNRFWNTAYKIVLKNAAFCEEFLPIKCGDLAYLAKKLDGMIAPEEEDVTFCIAILLVNYIKRLRINADYTAILEDFGIDLYVLEGGRAKFNLDEIFIQ